MCHAQGPQRSDDCKARTRGRESSTLPLSHCAPTKSFDTLIVFLKELFEKVRFKSKKDNKDQES